MIKTPWKSVASLLPREARASAVAVVKLAEKMRRTQGEGWRYEVRELKDGRRGQPRFQFRVIANAQEYFPDEGPLGDEK